MSVDLKKLQKYLFENINIFKTFSNYNDFIAEFPTIDVQVDKLNDSLRGEGGFGASGKK